MPNRLCIQSLLTQYYCTPYYTYKQSISICFQVTSLQNMIIVWTFSQDQSMWLFVKFYLNLCLWYMYIYRDERWDTNSFIIQFVCFDSSSHDDGFFLVVENIFMNEFVWFYWKEELKRNIFVMMVYFWDKYDLLRSM